MPQEPQIPQVCAGMGNRHNYVMSKIISIEPAIDPNARPTFLLDWELTMKCNLDCSYCMTGHDNSTQHPLLSECLKSIDFMYEYVDLYMQHKPRWNRAVVLNVYGGESLYHPDIVEILQNVKSKYKPYQDRWPLKITTTTNAVIGKNRMDEIVDLIDEFTVSYHAESLPKQKQQVLHNLLLLKQKNKSTKCIILMHGNQEFWPELQDVIDFCKKNQIRYLAKHLDGNINSNYNSKQIQWFRQMWHKDSPSKSLQKQKDLTNHIGKNNEDVTLSSSGRACCGGRLLCTNTDLKHPVFYVPDNNFQDWSCSVNWFFLFVKQLTGEIFVNKDCQMNFDGTVSPIGHLSEYQDLIMRTKKNLDNNTVPVMSCAKSRCVCGLCAPKAKTKKEFFEIMQKHVKSIDVFDSVDLQK